MGTISGTTHITTCSLSPGTGKNFIGNALCSSDDSVTQLSHILHFFTINTVFYKPTEEIIQMKKLSVLLFFEEPTVSSDTFLAMMENIALRHVPMGTVFQSDDAPPHVSFWTWSF
jgi:hypothetical protein